MTWRLVVEGKYDEANAELASTFQLNPDGADS